jgi:hypothetical protein
MKLREFFTVGRESFSFILNEIEANTTKQTIKYKTRQQTRSPPARRKTLACRADVKVRMPQSNDAAGSVVSLRDPDARDV